MIDPLEYYDDFYLQENAFYALHRTNEDDAFSDSLAMESLNYAQLKRDEKTNEYYFDLFHERIDLETAINLSREGTLIFDFIGTDKEYDGFLSRI